jgi:homoserine kinase type II
LRPGLDVSAADDLETLARIWPKDLPRGVIHADLFPDNTLLMGDKLGGVIDFYFACTDFLAYDLAVALNAWCFEPRGMFNLTKGKAMIAGYESVRPLTPAERDALPTLARGAAMRFFATRLHDWNEDTGDALVQRKDPLEYADKLEFHRRATSAADYGG